MKVCVEWTGINVCAWKENRWASSIPDACKEPGIGTHRVAGEVQVMLYGRGHHGSERRQANAAKHPHKPPQIPMIHAAVMCALEESCPLPL